jgi:hypothetical protein
MFFYLYAIIELLAIFLDSGIIPTASGVYPVCEIFRSNLRQSLIAFCSGLRQYTLA